MPEILGRTEAKEANSHVAMDERLARIVADIHNEEDADVKAFYFEDIVRITSDYMYTVARRMANNDEDASEILQEAYLRAWRYIDKFQGRSTVSSWLFRITVNSAYSHLTKRNRWYKLYKSRDMEWAENTAADQDPMRDPVQSAVSSDLRHQLEKELAELPENMRLVVVLRDIYDLAHADIAKNLGISETACKVRLHRARKILRERMFS